MMVMLIHSATVYSSPCAVIWVLTMTMMAMTMEAEILLDHIVHNSCLDCVADQLLVTCRSELSSLSELSALIEVGRGALKSPCQ